MFLNNDNSEIPVKKGRKQLPSFETNDFQSNIQHYDDGPEEECASPLKRRKNKKQQNILEEGNPSIPEIQNQEIKLNNAFKIQNFPEGKRIKSGFLGLVNKRVGSIKQEHIDQENGSRKFSKQSSNPFSSYQNSINLSPDSNSDSKSEKSDNNLELYFTQVQENLIYGKNIVKPAIEERIIQFLELEKVKWVKPSRKEDYYQYRKSQVFVNNTEYSEDSDEEIMQCSEKTKASSEKNIILQKRKKLPIYLKTDFSVDQDSEKDKYNPNSSFNLFNDISDVQDKSNSINNIDIKLESNVKKQIRLFKLEPLQQMQTLQ